uniref:PPM-type phosphatase domain-containing protein n=1 Tax=Eutreptiella gymnastica TaxID=73025 RepID=A0A7S1IRS3_9EUGL
MANVALECDLGEIDGDVKVQREKHGETRICAVSPTLPHRPVDMQTEVPKPPTPLSQDDIVIQYGLHSVQGHRAEMEDDHKCVHKGQADPLTPAGTDQEDGKFDQDDDNYTPQPNTSFFGVYDGHAGTAAANFLRKNLHRVILRHPKLLEEPELAAKEGIAKVEDDFMQYAEEQRLDAGSTLAIVLIIGTDLIVANVGDSEVVLNRKGTPMVLTTIHNMKKNEKEEDRIRKLGGRIHHKRLGHPKYNPSFFSIAVTRSIGDVFFKTGKFTEGKDSGLIADADTRKVTLTKDDRFVIMGCDGLWDVMTHQQAVDFTEVRVGQGKTCQTISEELVNEALALGSTDNITALVITLRPPKPRINPSG